MPHVARFQVVGGMAGVPFRSSTWSVLVLFMCLGCLDTAAALAATISANPTSLSFCVATNNTVPPPQTFTLTSSDASFDA